MGLDTVELVMAVEEEFGIEVTNEAAMHMLTVGDMQDYVVQTLQQRSASKAVSIELVARPAR